MVNRDIVASKIANIQKSIGELGSDTPYVNFTLKSNLLGIFYTSASPFDKFMTTLRMFV